MKKDSFAVFAKSSKILEYFVAAILLLAIFAGAIILAYDIIVTLITTPDALDITKALSDALALAVGIEFVKMLVRHTPGAVVEVLLFAIAREMVVIHTSAFETLVGVIAVGVIFVIRRYLCSKPTEDTAEIEETA